jgi:hypothetical protein
MKLHFLTIAALSALLGCATGPAPALQPIAKYYETHPVIHDQCIPDGQTCTIGGTPCCSAALTCSGTFPNTRCQ